MSEVAIYNAQQTYNTCVPNLVDLLKQQDYSFNADRLSSIALRNKEPARLDMTKNSVHERLVVIATSENSIPSNVVTKELEVLSASVPGIVLVVNKDLSTDTIGIIQMIRDNTIGESSFNIQYFTFDDLVFNMNDSYLMHTHRLMNDKQEWYSSLKADGFPVREDTIPTIFIGDKLQRWYNAKEGDVFALQHLSSHYNYADVTLADGNSASLKVPRKVPYYRKVKYPTISAEEFTKERMSAAERATR